jgi:hypothetical protein
VAEQFTLFARPIAPLARPCGRRAAGASVFLPTPFTWHRLLHGIMLSG